MNSNYSDPGHRKVTRKRHGSVMVIPELDSLLTALIRMSSQPLDSLIAACRGKIHTLQVGVKSGKAFCPDLFVKFLQTYGGKLLVANSLDAIYREIERLSALSWLNARIFSSSLSWSNISTNVLINLRAEVIGRLYTPLSQLGDEVVSKEQELIKIIDYWLTKANADDDKKPGLSRLNKTKFAGVQVGTLNQEASVEVESGDESCEMGIEFESPLALQYEIDELLSELNNREEKSESFLKKEIAYNVMRLMKRLTEDGLQITGDDIVNLSGVALFWLTIFMGFYFGKITTVMLAPIMAFIPVVYTKVERNESFSNVIGSVGPRKLIEDQKKAMMWLMDCVLVRIVFICVAFVLSVMADQMKLLTNQHFIFLWDQLVYYGTMLEKNCMVYCGGGEYFPIQSKVEEPTDVMMKNGIFYLNGVKYTQVEGPFRRMQVLRVKHSKTGINRLKKPVSKEVVDDYGNLYRDVTELVSFRYLTKEIIGIIASAVGGKIKPRIDPQYYAALVNRWKQWG